MYFAFYNILYSVAFPKALEEGRLQSKGAVLGPLRDDEVQGGQVNPINYVCPYVRYAASHTEVSL